LIIWEEGKFNCALYAQKPNLCPRSAGGRIVSVQEAHELDRQSIQI